MPFLRLYFSKDTLKLLKSTALKSTVFSIPGTYLQFGQGLEFVTSHKVLATFSVSGHSSKAEQKNQQKSLTHMKMPTGGGTQLEVVE